jgi:DNA-binding NtrC family response regulator
MRAQAEIFAITRALEVAGWNRKRAAQLLRISYRGLLYKISSHKITRSTKADMLGAAEGTISFATEQIK